jgi:hypothetical protein
MDPKYLCLRTWLVLNLFQLLHKFLISLRLHDLFAFMYLIFVVIVAYGIVSRPWLLYKQIPFTAHGIFKNIFYTPYWLLYTSISDKDELDGVYTYFLLLH